MCRWKKLAVMKPRLILRYRRAKQKMCQLKAVLQLVRRQLPWIIILIPGIKLTIANHTP